MPGYQSKIVLAAVLAAATASAAFAQEAASQASAEISEVVVTAQKRTENIQDVPLAIRAVSGAALEDAGIQSVIDLGKLVPALQINDGFFNAGVLIRIRGFGTAADGATDSEVAEYLDSAYVPRPGAIIGSFLDVKNVEVLSGPQGTLFGRNATLGAISINTNAPSTVRRSFAATIDGANYGSYALTAIANLPVNEQFALRLAAKTSTTDGIYKTNIDGKTYGKRDQTVARVSAKWDVTDSVSWILRVDSAKTSGDGANPMNVYVKTASAGQLAAFSAFQTRFGGTPPILSYEPTYTFNSLFAGAFLDDKQSGVTSDLSWKMSPAVTARLINSYRHWHNKQRTVDSMSTSLDLLRVTGDNDSKAQSHELQFISEKGAFLGSKLGFTAGLYYSNEDYTTRTGFDIGTQWCTTIFPAIGRAFLVPGCLAGPRTDAAVTNFSQTARSTAGYLQFSYALLPGLDLDLGARNTRDRKSGGLTTVTPNPLGVPFVAAVEGPETLKFDDNDTSFRASLAWHVSDDVMVFGTYSTGYKSGGFNSGPSSPASTVASRTFGSESVDDIELGVKSVLWNRRLLLNASFFNTKLKGFQDRSFNGTAFVTRNAGDVRSRGLDLDAQIIAFDNFKVTLAATYLDSIYADNKNAPGLPGCTGGAGCPLVQDLTGKRLAFAPKWHGNFGFQWDSPKFSGDYSVTVAASQNITTDFLTANTLSPQSRVPGYSTTDMHASLNSPDARWQFELYGSNVFDKRYYNTTVAQVAANVMAGVNDTVTGSTVYRAFLGDPARYGARISFKF